MEALASLVIAITGLPALGIAVWYARSGLPHDRGTALRWALIALSIFAGAIGLYFSRGNQTAETVVGIGMVVLVNVLVVSMVLHLRRGPGRNSP